MQKTSSHNPLLKTIAGVLLFVLFFSAGVFTERLGLFNLRRAAATRKDYKRPVPEKMIRALGQPHMLDKETFRYSSEPNTTFLQSGNIRGYAFKDSILGEIAFINNPQNSMRGRKASPNRRDVRDAIMSTYGVRENGFGALVLNARYPVRETPGYSIWRRRLEYRSGAVIEYYYGEPAPGRGNGVVLFALHGCSSSPDKVMGLTGEDYTNSFGLKALEQGYTVAAPYLLNACEWLDDVDTLGAVSSGVTSYGYEIMKILALSEYIGQQTRASKKVIWGISLGGQVAAFSAVLDPSFHKVVVGGSMVFDYRRFVRSYMLPFSKSKKRTPQFFRLFGLLDFNDVIISIFPRPVILEVGSWDDKKGMLRDIESLREVSEKRYSGQNVFKVNFFRGYHETNPAVTLDLLERMP